MCVSYPHKNGGGEKIVHLQPTNLSWIYNIFTICGQPSSHGSLSFFVDNETLATRDKPKLLVLDNFAHKAYTQVSQSSNHKQKIKNLMKECAENPLVVLRIHGVSG